MNQHFPGVFQYLKSALTSIILLSGMCVKSQTGPAGIQTSATCVFWVKADAGTSSTTNSAAISAWNDQSGNGINLSQVTAAQQPSYVTNVINGFPAVQFDNVNGTNDKMTAADNSILDNTSGYSFFMVTRPQTLDGTARCVVSKRTNVGVDQSFMHFYYTSNNFFTDIQTTNDRYNTGASFAVNTNYLITQQFDGTLASGSRCRTYVAGALNVTAAETSTLVPDNASNLLLGSTDANDPRPFGGYIAEVIIYRSALTTALRIIVENYLSAKYNISISNDKYAGDNAGNGDYDRDVAGVGQESTGSSSSFSPVAGAGLGISINSGLDNGDYVLAGHATAVNSVAITDVGGMTGTNNSRWQRVWYIDVTNGSTALNANISFDFSDAGLTFPGFGVLADYVLLYRSGQTGNWTEVTTASGTSGDAIYFNNLTLSSDGYYTLGTKNYYASPLPIELLHFTAMHSEGGALLSWETVTEKNAKEFLVESSSDALTFTACALVPAAGHSSELRSYQCICPLTETDTYYRLTSIEMDGTQKRYPIVVLQAKPSGDLHVYPVPATAELFMELQSPAGAELFAELRNADGKICLQKKYSVPPGNNLLVLPTDNLANGSYQLRIARDGVLLFSRIIVK